MAFRGAACAVLAVAVAHAKVEATLAPDQIRIALTHDAASVVVSWATSNTSTPASYSPIVQWGPTAALGSSAAGVRDQNYTVFGVMSPQLFHAVMTALPTASRTFYRVGDANGLGWSEVRSFVSAPPAGARAYPVSFAAYGDMGVLHSENTQALVTRLVASGAINFTIHAGDISYANNRIKEDNGTHYDAILSLFYNQISPYASTAPYMISVGNHEATAKYSTYYLRVAPTMPTDGADPTAFWYTWSYGPITFIALSGTQEYKEGSPQWLWLSALLPTIDRSATPWLVVYLHYPLTCSNLFWCPDQMPLRNAFEPLFIAHRVDLVLAGHVHAAEVVYPVVNGTVVAKSFSGMSVPWNLMTGYPGDIEVCCNDWVNPAPEFSAWRGNDTSFFGMLQMTILNDTDMRADFWDADNSSIVASFPASRTLPPGVDRRDD